MREPHSAVTAAAAPPAGHVSASPHGPGLPAVPRLAGFWHVLGPGLLFAGAAIGVSHLIQSTRAGALHGLALVPLIVLVHVLKYPALSAGPRYAAATGTSLLQAYRNQGRHALIAWLVVLVGTAFTIQAAISLVTAAVTRVAFGLPADVPLLWIAIGLQLISAGLLAAGGFRWLDLAMKLLMVVLAVTTLFAAATQLPALLAPPAGSRPLFDLSVYTSLASLGFLLALIGWMPAPLDIAVWNSLWSLEKRRRVGCDALPRTICLEFVVCYGKCALLAIAFVVLGAALMHRPGIEPADGPALAAQVIDLYVASLGEWGGLSRPLIGVCAFAVMFSTLLTVTDALPRTAVQTVRAFATDERGNGAEHGPDLARRPAYWACLAVLIAAATAIVWGFAGTQRFTALVDLATILSFLGTPVLAWFNHRAMHHPGVPAEHRPRPWETALSWTAIAIFTLFALVYAWTLVA